MVQNLPRETDRIEHGCTKDVVITSTPTPMQIEVGVFFHVYLLTLTAKFAEKQAVVLLKVQGSYNIVHKPSKLMLGSPSWNFQRLTRLMPKIN